MAEPKNNGTPKKFKQPQKPRPRSKTATMMTSDSDKCKMIQQQLLLFIHAFDCQRRENGPEAETHKNCVVPLCKVMKDKLNHLSQCQEGSKCAVPDCAMSRQILDHWRDCANRSDCVVCSPISINAPSAGPRKIDWKSAQANKEWKNPINRDQRDSLVILLFQAILSSCDKETVSEDKMSRLTEFAKNVEAKAYATAKSNQEYYHLLVEKVYQIQRCIEEKVLKKKKQTIPLSDILQRLDFCKI